MLSNMFTCSTFRNHTLTIYRCDHLQVSIFKGLTVYKCDHLPSTVVTVCKRDCQSCHLENNRQLFRHCQDNNTTDNDERTNW